MESDNLDMAAEREEIARSAAIQANAKDLEPGVPGMCVECGEEHPRLVRQACPACRVLYRREK